ncbi:MAG: MATE family efflux transporter [Robiginitomaculum sp.]
MTQTVQIAEKTQMPATWRGEMSGLLRLGVPMGATQLAQFAVFTIDVVMIGRLGAVDLAAASLGAVFFFGLWMLGAGPVMAVAPLISQALGANKHDRHDARITVRMTLWLLAMMTPFVIALCVFAEPLSLALGQDAEVARRGAKYAFILALCWPFSLAVTALRNFLAAIGKTAIPFVLVMMGTLMNGLLNYVFIFGHFGAPRLELVGAGIASLIATLINLLMFIAYIRMDKHAREFDVFERFWNPHWDRLKEIFRLGWPISITTFFEGMLFNSAVFIVGIIGVAEQAAYNIGLNVASLAFMFPFGLSMAGSVRMGLAVGAGNRGAMKRVSVTTILACIVGIGFAAIPIALFPDMVSGLYLDTSKPDSAQVVALVATFLPIAAGFMLFDSVQVAANQLLRGLKDVRWPMALTGFSYWMVGFPVAYWLGLHTDFGARGVWYGLLAGLSTASVLLGYRLWRLVWRA